MTFDVKGHHLPHYMKLTSLMWHKGTWSTKFIMPFQGRIQDFKLGGAHLKKMRRAEGGAKIVGVFRVKNHDFTSKNHIFSNFRGHAPIAPPPPTPLDPPLHLRLLLFQLQNSLQQMVISQVWSLVSTTRQLCSTLSICCILNYHTLFQSRLLPL